MNRFRIGFFKKFFLLLLLAGPALPGWGGVILFVPFGLLAGLSDQRLLVGLAGAEGTPDLMGFERSAALGGLIGTLLMGSITQTIGLGWALQLAAESCRRQANASGWQGQEAWQASVSAGRTGRFSGLCGAGQGSACLGRAAG